MIRTISKPTGLRFVILLAAALMLVLIWGTAAYAQASGGQQYGSQTASGEAAISKANIGGTSKSSSGTGSSGTGSSGEGYSGEGASEGGAANATGLEVLPSTGGPILPFIALGVFALSATGLIALRRNNR